MSNDIPATNELNIAVVQMRVDGGQKAANLDRAAKLIQIARDRGADLALLPEALDLGWTHPSSREAAEPIPGGAPFQRLASLAASLDIHLCAGLTEGDQDQVFNSAIILDNQGNLLLKHRKLNELEIGHSCYDQGDRLNVCDTRWGRLGLMICADGFARDRVLARALGYMGADLILSPSAWAVPSDHDPDREPYGQLWRDSYIPVAREFKLWIIAASNVGPIEAGPWAGRKCIGCSLGIDPDGRECLTGPYGEEAEALLQVKLHLQPRPARGCGWESHWSNE